MHREKSSRKYMVLRFQIQNFKYEHKFFNIYIQIPYSYFLQSLDERLNFFGDEEITGDGGGEIKTFPLIFDTQAAVAQF
jgi:hypothetical protein